MTKSFRDALIAPPVTLSSSPDTQRQLVRKAGPHRSHGRECLLKVGPCQRVERLGVDVAGRRSPPSLARSRGRRLEPAMSHRCNWDMVRRLFALVLVLVVAGCGGGSHVGHGGASRHQSPLSARSSAVASSVARPGQLHGVPLTGATGLVLLVSADPPYLLDVDTGRVTPVKGLSVHGRGPVLSVLAVGRDAVVWVDRR